MLAHGVHHSRELTWCLLNDNLFLLRLADRDPRTGPGLISLYTTRAYSREQKFREKSLEIRGFPPLSHDIADLRYPTDIREERHSRTNTIRTSWYLDGDWRAGKTGGPLLCAGFFARAREPDTPRRPPLDSLVLPPVGITRASLERPFIYLAGPSFSFGPPELGYRTPGTARARRREPRG